MTAGSAGVAAADASGVTWEPAYPVQAVSAVGAGDSFVAGLSFALAQSSDDGGQADWGSAVRFGVAAAAASCELVRAGGAKDQRIREIFADLSEHHGFGAGANVSRVHVTAGMVPT